MTLYTIVEYKSTVICTVTDSVTLVSKAQVREKTNAYATTIGKIGILFTNTQNDNYNAFSVDDFANLEITDSAGNVYSGWVNVDDCLVDVNRVLQLDITATILGDIIISSKDVEIVEMCDTHLCSDNGASCSWDGGGAPNTLGISVSSTDAEAVYIARVDWGDGIVEDFNMSDAIVGTSHNYTVADYGTKTVRIIVYEPFINRYFVIIGQIVLTGAGDASSGTWTDNISLGQKTTKFLRHFVYNSDGTLDSSYDTLTNGTAYISGAYVNEGCCSCGDDNFYTLQFFGGNVESLYSFILLADTGGLPTTTTLNGGEWHFVSVSVLLGTPTLNGVALAVGYNFNYSDNNVSYGRDLVLVTSAANKVLLTAYKIVKL